MMLRVYNIELIIRSIYDEHSGVQYREGTRVRR